MSPPEFHRLSPEAEQNEIQRVTRRLTQQFPEVPAEDIERLVHVQYSALDDSPIREFVPVLVERKVRDVLAKRGP
jgi:hypothetical protein